MHLEINIRKLLHDKPSTLQFRNRPDLGLYCQSRASQAGNYLDRRYSPHTFSLSRISICPSSIPFDRTYPQPRYRSFPAWVYSLVHPDITPESAIDLAVVSIFGPYSW
ncbi:hypothetical protein VTL71DRAFT_7969 [Oculimacula yallundae]|uniref:Uncharacterized protein n=1 Tax=Oculimacula yallundae TaxID=86028 RepID=A0ABR4CYI5_9HELO